MSPKYKDPKILQNSKGQNFDARYITSVYQYVIQSVHIVTICTPASNMATIKAPDGQDKTNYNVDKVSHILPIIIHSKKVVGQFFGRLIFGVCLLLLLLLGSGSNKGFLGGSMGFTNFRYFILFVLI